MRARKATTRVSSTKVLWLAFVAFCLAFISATEIRAQPPDPVPSSDVPMITVEELARVLGEKLTITLHLKDAEPQQVLDELSRQTGLSFRPTAFTANREPKPVTVDVEGKEFWPALDELSRQIKVTFDPVYSPDYSGSGFRVLPVDMMATPEPGNGPQSRSPLGAMRVDSLTRSRTLRWSPDGTSMPSESLSLILRIRLDPRIRLLGISYQPKIDEATDNVGRSLAPTRPAIPVGFDMHEGNEFNDASGHQFHTSLRGPGPQAQRVTRLKGSVRLRVATRSETWETDLDAEKPRTKTIQRNGTETTLSIAPWQRRDGKFEIEFAVREPEAMPGAALNNRQAPGLATLGQTRVLDAANRELLRSGGTGGGSARGVQYHMSFSSRGGENGAGEPAKLIWTIPIEWKDVEIPFEFKDLPLP